MKIILFFLRKNMRSFFWGTLLITAGFSELAAQKGKEVDPIRDIYFPTYNSDYFYYVQRNDYRLDHGLIGVNLSSSQSGENADSKTQLFIPLFNSDELNIVVPLYVYETSIRSEIDEETVEHKAFNVFGQFATSYRPNDKWLFMEIIESHARGDEENIFNEKGNDIASFSAIKYNFNEKFQLAGAGLVRYSATEKEFGFIPAGQLFYTPFSEMRLMVGIPGLVGIEYSAPYNFDFVTNVMMNNPINVTVALRRRWTERIETTLRFIREGDEGVYFTRQNVNTVNTQFTYDNISFVRNIYQIEFGFFPIRETLIQLRGGFLDSEEIAFMDGDNKEYSVEGEDEYFFGVNVVSKFDL